jgi:hypothetical protein
VRAAGDVLCSRGWVYSRYVRTAGDVHAAGDARAAGDVHAAGETCVQQRTFCAAGEVHAAGTCVQPEQGTCV